MGEVGRMNISPELARALSDRIGSAAARSGRELRFMEVCGTHTMAIFASGLRSLLPKGVRLISGPGCPVCVTPQGYIDRAIAIARQHGVVLATFGDMMRVPASGGTSLERERAGGLQVLVVYSPLDALRYAEAHRDQRLVFLAVGFETTAPAVAATVLRAKELGLSNFMILAGHKLIPPAMEAVLAGGEVRLDGFICPGHVSVIIGSQAYEPIARRHHIGCVVAGFEAADVLLAIAMLAEQLTSGRAEVEIEYRRCVSREGNRSAQELLARVFDVVDAEWRGLGEIPSSGLALKEEYRQFDAGTLQVELPPSGENPGCRCGDVLAGRMQPPECPLYGRACTPASPVGPCMVSSEGSCAAHYKYGR